MKWLLLAFVLFVFASCKKTTSAPEEIRSDVPVVEAPATSKAGPHSVELSAKISDIGTSTITEAGFVLDSSGVPTLEKNLIKIISEVGAGGNISASVSNLVAGTTYNVRSFARNSSGAAYGQLVSFSTLDEKVFNGDVTLSTQAEVDAFVAKHINRINGDLIITGTVTDLSSLTDLVAVSKLLSVSHTTQLRSTNGLQNIRYVNTQKTQFGIWVQFNDALKDLTGFEGITNTYGEVNLLKNPKLSSLKGLHNLKTVEAGILGISDCDSLISLEGLEGLETVDVNVTIIQNDLLIDISALRNLARTKTVAIGHNQLLRNVNGLGGLETLQGVHINSNPSLNDIKGLNGLKSLERLQIEDNSLVTLEGLENLTSVKSLTLQISPELVDLSALASLTSVDYLTINRIGVTNLHGFEGLNSLVQITLFHNAELDNLSGLENVRILHGLVISENPKITSIAGLGNLSQLSQADFYTNPTLSDFCPLKNSLGNYTAFVTSGNAANPTKQEVLTNCP